MSAPATTAAPSKSERAYAWIRQRIQDQEFTAGYRLVLAGIAEALEMSVVPVREAIRRLEAEGLVTYERNVGAFVSMVDEAGYTASMQALSLVEAAATALSAPHLDAVDLRRARDLNRRMGDRLEKGDTHACAVLNQELHATLFGRCPNARLLDLVRSEWTRLSNMRDTVFTFIPERVGDSVREHDQLIDLIEAAASSTVIEGALRRHRGATLAAFLAHQHGQPPLPPPDLTAAVDPTGENP